MCYFNWLYFSVSWSEDRSLRTYGWIVVIGWFVLKELESFAVSSAYFASSIFTTAHARSHVHTGQWFHFTNSAYHVILPSRYPTAEHNDST